MPAGKASSREWLLEQFSHNLAQAFEAMAGARPEVHIEAGSVPSAGSLLRRQAFNGIGGAVWIAAAESDWTAAGQEVLRAADIENADNTAVKSTYLETIGQAFSAFAPSLGARAGTEVTCETAEETSRVPQELIWNVVRLSFPSIKVLLEVAFEQVLTDQLFGPDEGAAAMAIGAAQNEVVATVNASKTFDLLLDVELPVSVSFGRAQVPLKDLIKLTTGSIVELNRAISEPVEVIVNNCVIARGEVVVVEGNFGVRIQQVVSRQERLRTLA